VSRTSISPRIIAITFPGCSLEPRNATQPRIVEFISVGILPRNSLERSVQLKSCIIVGQRDQARIVA
jgi:hypothetical protein